MPDDIMILNKSTGKAVATHRSEQNISIEKHYPPDKYGECEIVVLPDGVRVDLETMENPLDKAETAIKEESLILTKMRELETANKTDYRAEAIVALETEGKIRPEIIK